MPDLTNALLFGIPVPALILLLVELLKLAKIVNTSDHARIANVLLSAACAVALIFVAKIDSGTMQMLTIILSGVYNIVVSALTYNGTIGKKRDEMLAAKAGGLE